jgi:hypothetical protein
MELITILNRCHHFRGFVYHQARLTSDPRALRSPCGRASVPPPSAHAAIRPHPATINSPNGALSSSRCGLLHLPVVRHAARRLPSLRCQRRRRSPLARWQTYLNRSRHVVPGPLGAPPVLERNRRGVSLPGRRSSMPSSTLSPGASNTGLWDRSMPPAWTRSNTPTATGTRRSSVLTFSRKPFSNFGNTVRLGRQVP